MLSYYKRVLDSLHSMANPNKPLFEWIKCLTRRYIITTIIILAILINTLFYIVEYFLQKNGYSPDLLGYQLVLFGVTIFVVIFVIVVFLSRLDWLRDRMILNLKTLIKIIRNQTEQDWTKKITIENLACDDEVFEIVEVLNQKTEQIDQYVNHLHYVIWYIQHEFNTPLATLSLWLERLKKEHKDIDISSFQEDIDQLSLIMNSLASLSSSHEREVEIKDVVVESAVKKVISDLRELHKTKEFIIAWNTESIILTHELYLHLILRNVIENASKYSDKWSKVFITLWDQTISIRDTWVWMSPESLENMWKPFWQRDKSRWSDAWFWLGLSLVKRLTDLLHIKVSVTSKIGKGTEFVLYFSQK